MIELTFGWPPKELSPNWRGHWSKKAKAAKKYKSDCYWTCVARKGDRVAETLALDIAFHPPSKRRIDTDNCLAHFKYGLDAISDYFKIDDSKFTYTISKSSPVKGGAVRVAIG